MKKRRTAKKNISMNRKDLLLYGGIILLTVIMIILGIYSCVSVRKGVRGNTGISVDASKPDIDVQLLEINEYSRPGIESDPITGIVIHYTANPGSSAQNNRDYFEGLKDSHETSASSHFVIGMEGEIVQCVPTWELAYASNGRNHDTVSIECCHPDETGKFTDATYKSVIQLTAWLCKKYNLTEQEVIRHYDVTGKNCPKYYVEHEEEWELFKGDVKAALLKSE
jgi:N-acetylmuramoyl-L-alanine amidase